MTDDTQTKRIEDLEVRVSELRRERDNLAAVVDILQSISASLHFEEILQTIARKLGEAFGLDRSSIFLSGERGEVRLVASYEDPSIRNLVVDLDRYPELKRAFKSGETVFVPDAMKDPMFLAVRDKLDQRKVRAIVVVPIRWRQEVIGAIFLRTKRDALPFTDTDLKFCQTIAELTGKALRNAHRFEAMLKSSDAKPNDQRRSELPAIALLGFLRRLLDRYASSESHAWAETLLAKASDEELERLVGVTLQVIEEEAKG
ncbi:MAG TPA: GAF domain-containing protein [Polyangiales bacterium]|jgi:GAF domain-containing protein|nr:GAF domain-containing protein [Polyangiales bacterium]